jgi:ribokinase
MVDPALTASANRQLLVAGSLNLDLVGRAPRIPAPGQTVLGGALSRHAGGKGGNQAVAAARLGVRVQMAAAVGRDAAGEELAAGLAREGIDTGALLRVDEPTGAALITVSEAGENAITVLPGANRFAPAPPARWPAEAGWLLLQLEIPLQTNLAWARAARAAGARVMLNAAPAAALPPELLQALDVLVVNENELLALAEGADPGGATGAASGHDALEPALDPTLEPALQAACRLGPRVVVVTLGGRGCLAARAAPAAGAAAARPVQLLRQAAFAVPVVDTTGAGDTFTGALAASLLQGANLDDALRTASAAAALACTRHGAREGMPDAQALAAFLARAVAD